MCTTWRCLYDIVAACDSGLNTCSKPHLSSACVAQSAALRAATPVTRVRIQPVPFFCFFFFINPLNSVFGLFSNIKPLTIWFTFFPVFYCERFTGLSSACPDCFSQCMICECLPIPHPSTSSIPLVSWLQYATASCVHYREIFSFYATGRKRTNTCATMWWNVRLHLRHVVSIMFYQ